MNAAIMWFVLSACAEAYLRLEISAEFWGCLACAQSSAAAERRPVPERLTVQGSEATPDGQLTVFQHLRDGKAICRCRTPIDAPRRLRPRHGARMLPHSRRRPDHESSPA